MNPNEIFADMLVGEEAITATAGAPGATLPDGAQVWWQLALTPYRLLVARLVQRPKGWVVEARHAATRQAVKIAQFPAPTPPRRAWRWAASPRAWCSWTWTAWTFTPSSPALDRLGPARHRRGGLAHLHPKVEAEGSDVDTKKLLILAAVCFALLVMCCGCGGFLVVARDFLWPMVAEAMGG
ncbi:MAG: hypothetical protein IPN01_22230 [Deltaproteobacteria bacterium]|nr:hypothetical protein [Deltaproteobacteria bacterium]